jgi:muramoyltetrapeptide carboxypeptidase LdcA involved in peptidoglycan recycling
MNKKGKILSTKGISRKNKNEASSLSMRMVIMIISCDILKNKSNLFLGFSLSTGEYLPYEQKMGVTGIHEIHFLLHSQNKPKHQYMELYMACTDTSTPKWQAQRKSRSKTTVSTCLLQKS